MFTDLIDSYKLLVYNHTVNLQSSSKVLGRLLFPSSPAPGNGSVISQR